MKLPINRTCALIAVASLALSAPTFARERPADVDPLATSGPAADYPIVLGAPFTVEGKTYTPADTMNYDAVGYASPSSVAAGSVISGAHRTLPLPSYVEVTSLNSGRTILVRLERRGPMSGDRLIELSAAAAEQLGVAANPKAPVRVRRVNPPEAERALLRTNQTAPMRMETPKSLLGVLMRRLDPQAPIVLTWRAPDVADAAPTTMVAKPIKPVSVHAAKSAATKPAIESKPAHPAESHPNPAARSSAMPPVSSGSAVIQVAAFASKANAQRAAAAVGGRVSASGKLSRVVMGPFANAAQASAALAKARAAGYMDARIQHPD